MLTFAVPVDALSGQTYARFRLSSAADLGTTGAAADGEVEDYLVMIKPPTAAATIFPSQTTISTAAAGAKSVQAADVDGDGDMDLLSASRYDNKIAWYENNGSQNFSPHTISTSADGPYDALGADVDGDGDMDVVSVSVNDNKIAWYENNGSQNFTPHTISTDAYGALSVAVGDVDGDGDLDVLSASYFDDKIAWYENNGNQNFTPHTITTAAAGATSVQVADVDGDGDLDVLSASFGAITWYRNEGNQNFTPQTISTAVNGAQAVRAADVDGDGDLDVLSASYFDDMIAWYENDGNQNFTAQTISTSADSAISLQVADLDGDGDLDVLSASVNDDKIAWYENDGNRNFTPRTISTAADAAQSVQVADVDGDGDLDVLSASYGDFKIAWYENTSAEIRGLHIFYEDSAWDDPDGPYNPTTGAGAMTGAGANTFDDFAIADKEALLPGDTADFSNYTSYSLGINGIMIDVEGMPTTPTLATIGDFFEFRVGNDDTYASPGWTTAPAPIDVQIRLDDGDGGSDRITLIWPDNVIQKQWLEVTMLANDGTGLAIPNVHFWGNAIGETGNNNPVDAAVNATDQTGTRDNFTTFLKPAELDNPYDFNRDKRVNATDQTIARDNFTTFVTVLKLISPPEAANRGFGDGGFAVIGKDRPDRPGDLASIHQLDLPESARGRRVGGSSQPVTILPDYWWADHQTESEWQTVPTRLPTGFRTTAREQIKLADIRDQDSIWLPSEQDLQFFEIVNHDTNQVRFGKTSDAKLETLDKAFAASELVDWDF